MNRVNFDEEHALKIISVLGLARTLGMKAKVFGIRAKSRVHFYDATINEKGIVKVLSLFGPEGVYETLEEFANVHGVRMAK